MRFTYLIKNTYFKNRNKKFQFHIGSLTKVELDSIGVK